MIPFEPVIEWRYTTLIVWYLMALFSIVISSLLGLVIDKGWKPCALSSLVGFLFYWWLSWLFLGKPIWYIAEKLNQVI